MVLLRFSGALIGFFIGFFLAAELLQVSQVTPVSNQVLVVFLLAVACAILGWLGAPYATVKPMGWLVARIRATAAGDLVAGVLGGGVGLVLALFLAFPLSFLPGELGRYAPFVGAAVLSLLGVTAGTIKRADLQGAVRDIRGGRKDRGAAERLLLDTSVIIDGRIADIVRAGFIRGTLVVPRFILAELQFFADSGDGTRRERGRRGLEMLAKMQKESTVHVEVDDEDPDGDGADGKLVALARARHIPIVTNDSRPQPRRRAPRGHRAERQRPREGGAAGRVAGRGDHGARDPGRQGGRPGGRLPRGRHDGRRRERREAHWLRAFGHRDASPSDGRWPDDLRPPEG